MSHWPPEQPAVAFARLHTWKHEPQLFTSVFVLTGQPVVLPLQFAKPALHTKPQVPPPQAADALLYGPHT
jgi:hypothetical protein